jgi:uncharacterized membrane protein
LSLLGAYTVATGTPRLGFLPWNLFLAWVPYVLSRAIGRLADRTTPGTGITLVLPIAVWLLFLPNAPYIVTDLIHLDLSPPGSVLTDAAFIVTFAALGLALAVASLGTVHEVVRERLGHVVGWAFVASAALLTGAGVWLGRVLRWNSWDLFTNPIGLLGTIGRGLASPTAHVRPITFSAAFGCALFFLYLRVRTRSPNREA